MTWSVKQLEAIEARGGNLLVAAAAGSGKTTVLVERIIRRIIDEKIDIDKILVLTFTKMAAAEMRERICVKLNAELDKAACGHLERQQLLLSDANISTIHSFCQSIVRRYFYMLDLPPDFRIANEAERALIMGEVLESLFEENYEAGDSGFLKLVEHYCNDRGDQLLYNLVFDLYNYSCSQPWPNEWLTRLSEKFQLPEDVDINKLEWTQVLLDKFRLDLTSARQLLDKLVESEADAVVLRDMLRQDIQVADGADAALQKGWEEFADFVSGVKFGNLTKAGKLEVDELTREEYQAAREVLKKYFSDLKKEYHNLSAAELLADIRQIAPVMDSLVKLTAGFADRFNQAKLAKGLVDFDDLEHYCLRILVDTRADLAELKPSEVALELRESFVEVMVDEYQDTNSIQETILRLIARTDRPNLFMVGDVKQSIYRFRMAEPELFIEKYSNYSSYNNSGSKRIDLSHNYRSRAKVLAAVNFLFEQLMSKAVSELRYGEVERLNLGFEYKDEAGVINSTVEVHLLDLSEVKTEEEDARSELAESSADNGLQEGALQEELSKTQYEAKLIARLIRELVESKQQIFDKSQKSYRPVAYRDIVILLRSIQNKAGAIIEVLRDEGISVCSEANTDFFQETEIQMMVSLLNIIDNPRQDIHLAGVLRSPLVGLDATALVGIRLLKPEGNLWDAVTKAVLVAEEAQEQVAAPEYSVVRVFYNKLDKWRDIARTRSVAELIWIIFRDTGYYDYVGGLLGGLQRQANLRAFYTRAGQYETANFRGLFRFLRFMERMKKSGEGGGAAKVLGEDEDAVQVLSIHKSKGLEFPVVFIADMGKNFNQADSRAPLLMHKKLGLGPHMVDESLTFRYPTLARQALRYKLEMENKAEELRILYVAMTRAREKLIMVGATANLAAKCEKWCKDVDHPEKLLPEGTIAGAKGYLDWVCSAVARHPAGKQLRIEGSCKRLLNTKFLKDESVWEIAIHKKADLNSEENNLQEQNTIFCRIKNFEPVAEGPNTAKIKELLNWQYPHSKQLHIPAKMTVTEIERRFDSQSEENVGEVLVKSSLSDRPQFMIENHNMTALEYGILLHTVMQNIELKQEVSYESIKRQLVNMAERELIAAELLEAVKLRDVLLFLNSALGQRLRRAEKVWREVPFSINLPARRFYPDAVDNAETIFVQGTIDCLFHEAGELVLIDYKTDRSCDIAELINKYQMQLNLYQEAIEGILKEKVKEKYLYVFNLAQAVPITS